jgi:hypothetical protein
VTAACAATTWSRRAVFARDSGLLRCGGHDQAWGDDEDCNDDERAMSDTHGFLR